MASGLGMVGFFLYVVVMVGIFVFLLVLAARFVKAHQRCADALEAIANKLPSD